MTKKSESLEQKLCPHVYIRKAYYLGMEGDDYVCVVCGFHQPKEAWTNFRHRSDPIRAYEIPGNSLR